MIHKVCRNSNKWLREILIVLSFLFWMITSFSHKAFCADSENMEALIQLLEQKGIITQKEAKTFFDLLEKTPEEAPKLQDTSLEASESFKKELEKTQEQLDQDMLKMMQQNQLTERKLEELNKKVKTLEAGKEEPAQVQKRPSDLSGSLEEESEATPEASKTFKKELEKTQEQVDQNLLDLLQRHRLTERKLEELDKKVTEDISRRQTLSSWAEKVKLSGNIRLRYQNDRFGNDNGEFLKPDDPTEVMNTTEDRSRFRGRIRLDLNADLIDSREINIGKITAGVRVTGGDEDDPVSTNQTFGDYFKRDPIELDLYYLQWQYKPDLPIWGRIPKITVTGGRIPNPWFSSDLVWDEDLNLEGVAINLKTDTLLENKWSVFLTAGAFPLQEVELADDDKWLYGGQLGFEAEPFYGLNFKLGGAYYKYNNIVGEVNDETLPGLTDYTAPLSQQKGNTLIDIDPSSEIKTALAADFGIIDITGMVDLGRFHPVHVILEGNYAENIGFDRKKVIERTSDPYVEKDTHAYRFSVEVGYPVIREFGDWKFSYCHKYIEADAVLDAFTDSDFHLGGTNAKGWIMALEYGIYKNVWMKGRWLTADEIDGPTLAIDVLQIDLNARF